MKPNEIHRWIACWVVITLLPLPLYAQRVDSVYRNSHTSEAGTYRYCNPSVGINPKAPYSPHAVCMEQSSSERILRFYGYDENGDLTGKYEGSTLPAIDTDPTIKHEYFVNRKLKKIINTNGDTIFFYNTKGDKVAVHSPRPSQDRTQVFMDASLEFVNDQPTYRYGKDAFVDEHGIVHFAISDHLGSVVALLSAQGIEERKDYLPFGASWFESTVPVDDRGFNQMKKDADYYDYNARHYDPVLGKFLQADSIVPDGKNGIDYNRYAYTRNNPVIYNDDSGHFPFLVAALVGGALNALANKDNIQSFGQFAGVFTAGAIGGVMPGMGQALGGGIGALMAAGAATNVASNLVMHRTFGAQVTGRSFFASLASGAAGGAFSSVPLGDLKGFDYAMARGTRAAAGQITNTAIYGAFGYDTSLSGQSIGSAFGSAFASGLIDGSADPSKFAEQNEETGLYQMKDGAIESSLASSLAGGLTGAIISGRMNNGNSMMNSMANSLGQGLTTHVFNSMNVDQANETGKTPTQPSTELTLN